MIPARRRLFTLLGVPWTLGAGSAQFLPSRLAPGIILALILLRDQPLTSRLLYGVVFGLCILSVNVLHIVGHTLSARFVGAPMDEAIILRHHIQTTYNDDPLGIPPGIPPDLPPRIHLGRTVGGPLMNILAGLIGLGAWLPLRDPALGVFAAAHLLNGLLLALLPIRNYDGEIIWREARRLLRERPSATP